MQLINHDGKTSIQANIAVKKIDFKESFIVFPLHNENKKGCFLGHVEFIIPTSDSPFDVNKSCSNKEFQHILNENGFAAFIK